MEKCNTSNASSNSTRKKKKTASSPEAYALHGPELPLKNFRAAGWRSIAQTQRLKWHTNTLRKTTKRKLSFLSNSKTIRPYFRMKRQTNSRHHGNGTIKSN